jgi:PAS domain S-box-containing protein
VGHWELVPDEGRPRWSAEIFRIFGLDPEGTEPTFEEHERYVHPDDWPALDEAVGRACEDGTPFDLEFRLFRPDGEMRWMHAIGTAETQEDGTVARVFGTAQDVTERRTAEEALRENERFLQTVFDGIQDGITVRDRDLTLLKVNRWMEERFADRMPLVGRKCYEVFQGRDSICPWCPATRAMESSETQSEVVPYPCIDDPTGWLELTAFPLRDADGEIVGVIEHVKDVTDRVVAEEETEAYQEHLRRLAAELVQAEERERRRLAANLHDSVGQTLASAKLTLQGLEQQAEADPDLADGFRQAHELVGEAVEHTRSTVFDLSPPILHEVGFEAALASLVERTRDLHDLDVSLTEPEDETFPLSDEVRTALYRSVRELLHNVVRHAAAERAAVSVNRSDDHIRIVVEDDGMGFDPEASRGRGDVGGGFGLFDIRERMDYLGGHFDIRSMPERGTRVTLTAPLEPTG